MALTVAILKTDDSTDQRLVFGFASVAVDASGEPLVDSQGDIIEPAELERAAYSYVLKSRAGGYMHVRKDAATLVESVVITPEKLEKMGLPKDALPTGWWVGFRVDDDKVWQDVKKGKLKAFSIGGKGRREKVEG